jgi:hypothetical protein
LPKEVFLSEPSPQNETTHEVDLKDPLFAAFLGLLLPGLGHLYQRRTAKGILYLVCILGMYLYGWDLGGRRVVYASWRPGDRRWPYLCQVWVGLPAWPAMIQSGFNLPLGDFMRQPSLIRNHANGPNELDEWNRQYHSNFELGTVLTMVAGLLNILAIFDAAAGPVGSTTKPEDQEDEKEKKGSDDRAPPENRDDRAPATADAN